MGMETQTQMAKFVGCNRERIASWSEMSKPPKQMRKGFDRKLISALQTTREMLFLKWKDTPPEQAPRHIFHRDGMPEDYKERQQYRDELQSLLAGELVPFLSIGNVERLVLEAMMMGLREGRQWDSQFRRVAGEHDIFKIFNVSSPSPPPGGADADSSGAGMGEPVVIRDRATIERFLKEHPEARGKSPTRPHRSHE